MADANRLKEGLRVEIESAMRGASASPSVVLLLKDDRLPRALVTDSRGVCRPKILTYVDLLATVDGSATLSELSREAERTHGLPPLPAGALLLDVVERPSGSSYVVTGATAPREHLFVLVEGREESTFNVPLPRIAYRAIWDERTRSLSALSIALCSPDLDTVPDARTELYRWPFSNVYDTFGGSLEGVCWYQRGQVKLEMGEIPEKIVETFVGIPNDADRYARDLTHNAPYGGYRSFLEALEEGGGFEHDWLVPCGMTVENLHRQTRRKA